MYTENGYSHGNKGSNPEHLQAMTDQSACTKQACALYGSAPKTCEYLSCADTAKLVRAALKKHWPGVKFAVRSKTYSGGASIDVHWQDGPRVEDVDAVAGAFQGAKFNSLEDLKTCHETTITNPDGSTRTVQYGADYVFCSRTESDFDTAKAQALDMIRARCVLSPDGLRYGEDWIDNLAGRVVRARDYLKESDLEKAFRRGVYRFPDVLPNADPGERVNLGKRMESRQSQLV